MKPFNLEAALRGEPVITRAGREVTDLTYFPNAKGAYSIVGLAGGVIRAWCLDGSYTGDGMPRTHDLFMKPTTRKLKWVALKGGEYGLPALPRSNQETRILSAVVNEDGSVTVEVED